MADLHGGVGGDTQEMGRVGMSTTEDDDDNHRHEEDQELFDDHRLALTLSLPPSRPPPQSHSPPLLPPPSSPSQPQSLVPPPRSPSLRMPQSPVPPPPPSHRMPQSPVPPQGSPSQSPRLSPPPPPSPFSPLQPQLPVPSGAHMQNSFHGASLTSVINQPWICCPPLLPLAYFSSSQSISVLQPQVERETLLSDPQQAPSLTPALQDLPQTTPPTPSPPPPPPPTLLQDVQQAPLPLPPPPSRPTRTSRNPLSRGKEETIVPPFPWSTDRRATVHTMETLLARGIESVSGDVQCKRCEHKTKMEYPLHSRFTEVARLIISKKGFMHNRALPQWMNPVFPPCPSCKQSNSMKPVIAAKKRDINWLFMLLGQTIGTCTLDQLKYFCKHIRKHRTGAKNRVLYTTYLGICKQLDPTGPFDEEN